LLVCSLIITCSAFAAAEDAPASADAEQPVSYYRQVRPILQRHCSGCHQAAKKGGELLLTSYEGFQTGGTLGPAFTPGKPEESAVIQYVSGEEPLMPLNAEPLDLQQIETIARWITEGAKDDTPPMAQDTITAENPPSYARPPVITALAYSPDSTLLAVSGFHEILVHEADGSGLAARLVGRAQRINALAFSPDGTILAAVGGTPALFGEVQFWDVQQKKLLASETVSFDTLFGASFSDDGTMFAFGGADNRAYVYRLKRTEAGELEIERAMRFDAHADWVLGTTFSLKLDHLITVSRDMSMKLVIIENAQFVDNITSITPGALKGGLMALQRHPSKEQVLIGGADGRPHLYK
ncbi:MAG: c-type cytochrome domain-containing protein, partial [Planctomycetaceae bacterium]